MTACSFSVPLSAIGRAFVLLSDFLWRPHRPWALRSFTLSVAMLLGVVGCGGGGYGGGGAVTYTIGGTVSGLASGASVVLQNNGANNTPVAANGSFSFSTQVASGGAYAVTVLTQPTGQTCAVTNGSGMVGAANVTTVQIVCTTNTYTISGMVMGLNAGTQVVLKNNGADATAVKANGSFTFATPVPYNGSYAVTVSTVPTAETCIVSDGTGSSVNANVTGVSVSCSAATESVLYSFGNFPDGNTPLAALIQGSDGNFYGTTQGGGANGAGTVFKITPAGVESVLYSFGHLPDGDTPLAALIQGSDGNFYGTTQSGGVTALGGFGTVFKLAPNVSGGYSESVLYAFQDNGADGIGPVAALIQGSDGNFYGTTQKGGSPGSGFGAVFKLAPNTSGGYSESVLHSFGNLPDGNTPLAALIQGSDGNFYGTTQGGGPSNLGTVFKITPAGVESVLYSFGNLPDGDTPAAALIQGSDGNFYGTTQGGGASNLGTVFKLAPNSSGGYSESVLYSFGAPPDGQNPVAALIEGSDGNFYGTTPTGGAANLGTLFKITPAGVESVLYSFKGGADGGGPAAALIQGSDGNFYGTTPGGGGASNNGIVFKF